MIRDTVKDKVDAVRDFRTDDILAALGLERKRSALDAILPAAGIFVAGIIVGTGVALLLAPKSGREIRRYIKGKASDLTQRMGVSAHQTEHEMSDSAPSRAEDNGAGVARRPAESAASPK